MAFSSSSIRSDVYLRKRKMKTGAIVRGSLGEVPFQFNPTEFEESGGGAVWSETVAPAMRQPILTYGSGSVKTITFELYMNERALGRPVNIGACISKFREYHEKGEEIYLFYYKGAEKVVINEMTVTILGLDSGLNPIEANIEFELYTVK